MFPFAKKMLITLLVVVSGAALALSDPLIEIPPYEDFAGEKKHFYSVENISYMTYLSSQLNFKNESDYIADVTIRYKKKHEETKEYSEEVELFSLKIGETKNITFNGDDAFVRVSAIAGNKLILDQNICSYNNKLFNANAGNEKTLKEFVFTGNQFNPEVIYPNLKKEGYHPLNIVDAECWFVRSPESLEISEFTYRAGEKIFITQDTPDLYSFSEKMSSYKIPSGWRVNFYSGKNYTGKSYTRTFSADVDKELNDVARSVKIMSKEE